MPTITDHLALAHHNLQVLNHLGENKNFSDWVVNVSTYTALHLLEAMIYENKNDRISCNHCPDHKTREEIFKNIYPTIWKKYRPLISASKVARYLKIEEDGGQTFAGYYSYDVVCNILFKKDLSSIINQVKTHIRNDKLFTNIDAEFLKCKSTMEKNFC